MPVQLVFVHGVANRRDDDYDRAVRARDDRFEKLVFGSDVVIQNPYWGEFGANPPGGVYQSLPDYDDLGQDERLAVREAAAEPAPEAPSLVELARDDFPETVDLIFAEVFAEAEAGGGEISDDMIEAARIAAEYAIDQPDPEWVDDELSDERFIEVLMRRAEALALQQGSGERAEVELLGIGSWLRRGAKALVDRVRNAGGRLVLARAREDFHGSVARFIGDVFRYLKDGDGRVDIRGVVRAALEPALESGDPIVVVGHSMGGVILTDCLGDPAFRDNLGLSPDRKIDALVTVGSQPGFFDELELLSGRDQGASPLDVVRGWLNVYDELDALSFRASPLFQGACDLRFSSRTGIAEAHGAYFDRVQFYRRLGKRLRDLEIPVVGD